MALDGRLQAAYQALLECARAQREALDKEGVEAYLALEDERQARFEAVVQAEPEARRLLPNERDRLKRVVQQILAVDGEIEDKLLVHQDRNREEVLKLQPGIQALHAYVQESSRNAFFIDRNQ